MLVLVKNSQSYFQDEIKKVLKEKGLAMSEEAQSYIVCLLSEFSHTDKFFAGVSYGEKIVFADFLQRALESDKRESFRVLKHIGDASLYTLGFFNDFTKKSLVSPSYYVDMGAMAYSEAGKISLKYSATKPSVFLELSKEFVPISEIIKAVAKNNH